MPDPDYHCNAEIENAAQSQLLEPRRGLSPAALVVVFIIVALPVLAMPFWLQRSELPENTDSSGDNLLPPPGQVKLDLPPAATASAIETAAPSAQANADAAAELARQRAELEETRRVAEAEARARASDDDQKKWERYRSPMVVTETGQPAELPAEAAKIPGETEKSAATFQDVNPNTQLLGALSAKPVEVAKAEKARRIDALIPQGTMIRGVLGNRRADRFAGHGACGNHGRCLVVRRAPDSRSVRHAIDRRVQCRSCSRPDTSIHCVDAAFAGRWRFIESGVARDG